MMSNDVSFPDDTPETCIYSGWSPWSACSSATCDKGRRMRQRMLKAQLDLSVPCPHTQDFQPCMAPGCSVDGNTMIITTVLTITLCSDSPTGIPNTWLAPEGQLTSAGVRQLPWPPFILSLKAHEIILSLSRHVGVFSSSSKINEHLSKVCFLPSRPLGKSSAVCWLEETPDQVVFSAPSGCQQMRVSEATFLWRKKRLCSRAKGKKKKQPRYAELMN